MQLILIWYTFTMNFTFTLMTMAEMFLQIDLAITLAKPLAPLGNRHVYYIILSFIISFTYAICMTILMNPYDPIVKTLFFALKAIFFCSALISISSATIKFSRGGLSRQYRTLLLKRHLYFCFLSVVCNIVGIILYLNGTGKYDFPVWLL